MNGLVHLEPDSEFVEVDPTGRYGRYNEILGKGASKTVYKAFDEYEGIEVAWNQVKLYDFLQSPEDLERLYCEIHLLKTLKHHNIMKFYTSWVDTANRNINFVTEMFTSGTLRQYRLKHKRVNIWAVKHWCRQILKGLLYLHSCEPPVIHRDLKCDNIFINGNQGEVKIGDLGLAAILRKSHAVHCVGTPEFMAPEIYEEEYNELVDIYSFGMCILEMVTFEYPYSECTHPAQIYKKVMSGRKPDALYKVMDPEVRAFVEKCLATMSRRLSAKELLDDPFLQIEGCEQDLRPVKYWRELDYANHLSRPLSELDYHRKSISNCSFNGYSNDCTLEDPNGWECHTQEFEQSGIELFHQHGEEHLEESSHNDITVKGKRREDGSLFLRLRISDMEGRIRNIYFPFDVECDTALSVATEMVAELDIMDQDVTIIADMIDGEITALVPEWKAGPGIEDDSHVTGTFYCDNCASNHTSTGSLMNFLSHNPGAKKFQISQCLGNGCSATYGRFEEITYKADGPLHKVSGTANISKSSGQSNGFHHANIWDQPESHESSSIGSIESQSFEEQESLHEPVSANIDNETAAENNVSCVQSNLMVNKSWKQSSSDTFDISDEYEREIQQELKWLKSKHQMLIGKEGDRRLGLRTRSVSDIGDCKIKNGASTMTFSDQKNGCSNFYHKLKNGCPNPESLRARKCEASRQVLSMEEMVTANSLNTTLLPNTIHRTTSLPVDAVSL